MKQRIHKRSLYRRIRVGEVAKVIKLMSEVAKRLPAKRSPRPEDYDEFHKLALRGIDLATARETARIDKGVYHRPSPGAVNPFRVG